MVEEIQDFLMIEATEGMFTSGAKIFSDGTIKHTLFIDNSNNPYISIQRENVKLIMQVYENHNRIHINIFTKDPYHSTDRVDYFTLVESYAYSPFEDSVSDVPLLYLAICNTITNTCNKSRVRLVNTSDTVLTFKELIALEKFFKKRKKINICFGRNVMCLDSKKYSDLIAFENAIIYHIDRMAS